jgi:hypothetical protein
LGVNVAVLTTLVLPCGGTGKVTFRRHAFSRAARASGASMRYAYPAVSDLATRR